MHGSLFHILCIASWHSVQTELFIFIMWVEHTTCMVNNWRTSRQEAIMEF